MAVQESTRSQLLLSLLALAVVLAAHPLSRRWRRSPAPSAAPAGPA